MNTNQMGMHAVLVGNPVDGVTIYGPFKTGSYAIEWGDESFGEAREWWVAPLQAPEGADESKTEWQGPFDNPFAAAMGVAAHDTLMRASVLDAVLDVFDWDYVRNDTLLDDMLQEIAGKTNIVVQKRDDGWYAALDKDELENDDDQD